MARTLFPQPNTTNGTTTKQIRPFPLVSVYSQHLGPDHSLPISHQQVKSGHGGKNNVHFVGLAFFTGSRQKNQKKAGNARLSKYRKQNKKPQETTRNHKKPQETTRNHKKPQETTRNNKKQQETTRNNKQQQEKQKAKWRL